MAVKTTVAIIGATGKAGAAAAAALSKAPYRLLLMANNPQRLGALQRFIGRHRPVPETEVMLCTKDACWEAEVIILAVPFGAYPEVAGRIREVATGKTVISIVNVPGAPQGSIAAAELQRLLPYAKVIGAAEVSAAGNMLPAPGAVPQCRITGNDAAALETVSEMAVAAGFVPVVVHGTIA